MYLLKVSRSFSLVKISPSIICIKNTIFSIGLGYCVINQGHTVLSDRQIASHRSHHGVSLMAIAVSVISGLSGPKSQTIYK